ncbi:hypothetical protein C3941_19490 [Kaistia algarum]|uniref:hypothetical protein n=1 Tax=Kaistia algarum TaxID=2083279 RepID=UPI000CE8733A|nr:hypothetical protein [Kaistia algarum]MCX5516176.1 hypothetical protein [Kaistia algarum]PPE78251.1 hypothetical protein C3941_19490 [Kaistia algarum]
MGTKNNPSAFDCYHNAEPDEPMFILLARDPLAPGLVREWADQREAVAVTARQFAKVSEARQCADAMEAWAASQNREER